MTFYGVIVIEYSVSNKCTQTQTNTHTQTHKYWGNCSRVTMEKDHKNTKQYKMLKNEKIDFDR